MVETGVEYKGKGSLNAQLEELYYHTKEDSRYISELKKALIETGIYEDDENLVTKQLTLKFDFKQSDFYKTGKVVYNKPIKRSYNNVKSFTELGVSKKGFKHVLSSGFGKISSAFFEMEQQYEAEAQISRLIKISDIPVNVIRFALSQNPFYYFNNLERFFPNVGSISNFIADPFLLFHTPMPVALVFVGF